MFVVKGFQKFSTYLSQQREFRSSAKRLQNAQLETINRELIDKQLKWTEHKLNLLDKSFYLAEIEDIIPIFNHAIDCNLPDPYGINTWDSSHMMTHLLDILVSKSSLQGKEICDLGCGTGLSSFVSYLYGANVTAMDISDYSLELVRLSYERLQNDTNSQGSNSFRIKHFDMSDKDTKLPKCDYLLLSDVMYSTDLALLTADRVVEGIRIFSCEVLVTDPGRQASKDFLDAINKLLQPKAPFVFREFTHIKGTYLHIQPSIDLPNNIPSKNEPN